MVRKILLPVLEQHQTRLELVFCLLMLGRSMAASGSYWKARLYYLQVKHLLWQSLAAPSGWFYGAGAGR